ncbi:MAG: F0F1 ATP synthase subunit B [Anaerolineaceae bacterium]|nr:F0F1 ATP synthase subunit B [Anaerolineaceae bacterium]
MENLGLNLGYLLVQIFMFAIAIITINAWVIKPLMEVLEKRKMTIAKGLEDARVASEARENAETEAQKIIKEAQAKATELVRAATDRADAAAREIKSEAEVELTKTRENAKTELEQERSVMLGNLRSQVIALSLAGAQKLIGESLMKDEKNQKALLEEFFSGVKGGKVVVLEGTSLSGSEAEVTSALPLNEVEKKRVQDEILKDLGKDAQIIFRVDPGILGGIIIRVGDKVVDGSVASQLNELKQTLL